METSLTYVTKAAEAARRHGKSCLKGVVGELCLTCSDYINVFTSSNSFNACLLTFLSVWEQEKGGEVEQGRH